MMDGKTQLKRIVRWSGFLMLLIFAVLVAISLVTGDVPRINCGIRSDDGSCFLNLPESVSRGWDIFLGPKMAILMWLVYKTIHIRNPYSKDNSIKGSILSGVYVGFINGVFFAVCTAGAIDYFEGILWGAIIGTAWALVVLIAVMLIVVLGYFVSWIILFHDGFPREFGIPRLLKNSVSKLYNWLQAENGG